MSIVYPDQFLGLPPCSPEDAQVVILPFPLEKTVSYGPGCSTGPKAILDATCQIETFDEETLVDFEQSPKVHTAAALADAGSVEEYLAAVTRQASRFRDKFVISLGGEHTVTYGAVTGLLDDLSRVTIVQIDAHADLIDELDGLRWSHGTVMRRLWERGCRLVQIGIRSLSRSEYELASTAERITTFFAHRLSDQWPDVLATLQDLSGDVYLSFDVDGLDPSVIPSTGTPQPDGLSWPQAMELLRAVTSAPNARLLGADLVEFIASPHPPGCDLTAAKLLTKLVAYWQKGCQEPFSAGGP